MFERGKISTIFYIFCVTALQQILILAALASMIIFSIWSNFEGVYALLGLPCFFAILLLAIAVTIVSLAFRYKFLYMPN